MLGVGCRAIGKYCYVTLKKPLCLGNSYIFSVFYGLGTGGRGREQSAKKDISEAWLTSFIHSGTTHEFEREKNFLLVGRCRHVDCWTLLRLRSF